MFLMKIIVFSSIFFFSNSLVSLFTLFNFVALAANLFSSAQIWVLRVNFFFLQFLVVFLSLGSVDPWIRVFLRIRIQEAKILRIQRIRILSTAFNQSSYLSINHTHGDIFFQKNISQSINQLVNQSFNQSINQ